MSKIGHSLMKLLCLFCITLSLVMAGYNIRLGRTLEIRYDFIFGFLSLILFNYHHHMESLFPEDEE